LALPALGSALRVMILRDHGNTEMPGLHDHARAALVETVPWLMEAHRRQALFSKRNQALDRFANRLGRAESIDFDELLKLANCQVFSQFFFSPRVHTGGLSLDGRASLTWLSTTGSFGFDEAVLRPCAQLPWNRKPDKEAEEVLRIEADYLKPLTTLSAKHREGSE